MLAVPVLGACSSTKLLPVAQPSSASSQAARALERSSAAAKITHVVFIIQENRSFNFMFMGFPGALTQTYGYDSTGERIALHAQTLSTSWDIDHSLNAFFQACDGTGSLPGTDCKMDGWDKEEACCDEPVDPAFAHAVRSEVAPYWAMAKGYVLADHMFQSNLDGSFTAHQYAIAAYASRTVNAPTGNWGCEKGQDAIATLTDARTLGSVIRPCFKNRTIGGEADVAGVSWRSYAGTPLGDGGIWSAYAAIKPVYDGPDWKADVISPPAQFLTDIANGTLANVTWITPTIATSDHAGLNAAGGPAWVTSLVNAVGASPFWKNTAIFVMWDDWGGFYDPAQPVLEDYDGLGFRVPLIMISPYAKKNYVTHVQYETASVLRFMEDTFGLAPLAASDARAADPASDAFDFSKPPRKFKPFSGAKPAAYWLAAPVRSAPVRFGSMAAGD